MAIYRKFAGPLSLPPAAARNNEITVILFQDVRRPVKILQLLPHIEPSLGIFPSTIPKLENNQGWNIIIFL